MTSVEHTSFVDESKLVSLVPSTIRWQQLQPGNFDVAFKVLAATPLVISSRTMNLAFHGTAQVVPGRRSVVTIDSVTDARWRGSAFGAANIASGDEVDVRTTGASTLLAIAVDEPHLQRHYHHSLDASDIVDRLGNNRVTGNFLAAHRVRTAVRQVCAAESSVPPTAAGTMLALLAATVAEIENHAIARSHCLNRRYAAVRACAAYMREHIDETITLIDLSTACGMRSRSLINAFEAIVGLSPMDYLKRLRLSSVRSMLLRSDPRSTRVIDVATEWGFWHMGHFAHDYRVMFGEAPSQTLLSR
jgi:AraC-like DNA-binding protein